MTLRRKLAVVLACLSVLFAGFGFAVLVRDLGKDPYIADVAGPESTRESSDETSDEQHAALPDDGYQRPPDGIRDISDAFDIDTLRQAGDPNARECHRDELVTDTAQELLFSGLEQLRDETTPMPWERERALGQQLHEMLTDPDNGVYAGQIARNSLRQPYLQLLVEMLAEYTEVDHIQFRVFVVNDPMPNAYATIGGYLYVTTGLLESGLVTNEAQMVAILAHEMGHIDMRHTAFVADILEEAGLTTSATEFGPAAVILSRIATFAYSSQLETEADRYAYERIIEIGYSPFQMEAFFWTLNALEARARPQADSIEDEITNLFESHSHSGERACNIRRWVEDDPPPQRTYRGVQNFENSVPASEQVW